MDSFHKLYAIDFVISLYLILLIGVQIFNMTGLKFSAAHPNMPIVTSFMLPC
jgi:hypothetical protein